MSADSDFSGCFKVVIILAVVLGVVAWVFIKSSTLELQYETFTKDAISYQRTHYIFHWDRMGTYVKAIPGKIKGIFYPEPAIPGK